VSENRLYRPNTASRVWAGIMRSMRNFGVRDASKRLEVIVNELYEKFFRDVGAVVPQKARAICRRQLRHDVYHHESSSFAILRVAVEIHLRVSSTYSSAPGAIFRRCADIISSSGENRREKSFFYASQESHFPRCIARSSRAQSCTTRSRFQARSCFRVRILTHTE
jgi:hypothetical protein